MMSLIALPLIVGATREALQSIPTHVREASYALGKDKISTIRRVLLPGARRGIATGVTLGMGRIAGDTAIVVILLGATLTLERRRGRRRSSATLKGTGSTLTSYVYNNSPAGEGNSPEQGLRGGVRAADDRDPDELRRRPDFSPEGVIHGNAEAAAAGSPDRGGRDADARSRRRSGRRGGGRSRTARAGC